MTPLDEHDIRVRKGQLARTWEIVPRHQLHWRSHEKFTKAICEWRGDRSLVLAGRMGTGKTSACVKLVALLCRRALEHGGDALALASSVYWVDADTLSAAGTAETAADREVLRRAMEARILVLDDVATSSKTLKRVLRERLRRGLPTVLTSGAESVEDIATALGGKAVLRHVIEATGVAGDIVLAGGRK